MQQLLTNLKKRNIEAVFYSTRNEAIQHILEEINENKVVAWGGSVTLKELGIIECLENRNQKLLNRDTAKTPEEKHRVQIDSFSCRLLPDELKCH